MLDGFLVAHRDLIDSPVFSDPDLFRFWFYLRARANYQRGRWRGTELAVGDLIVSQRRLAEAMHVSVGTIGRWLTKLEKFGEITVKAGRDFSVVSVLRTDTSERAKQDDWSAGSDTDEDTNGDADSYANGDAGRHKSNKATKQPSNQAIKETPLPPEGEPKPEKAPDAMACPRLEEFPEPIRDEVCRAKWQLWLAYKRRVKAPYKTPEGHRAQLSEAAGDGRVAFLGCITQAMRHEWRGCQLRLYRDNLAKGEINAAGEPARAPPPRAGGLFDSSDPRGTFAAASNYLSGGDSL